jgi:endoglucanase
MIFIRLPALVAGDISSRLLGASRRALSLAAVFALVACASDVMSPDGAGNVKNKNGGSTPPEILPPDPPQAPPLAVEGNPILGANFWVNPYSNAKLTADSWRLTRPEDAAAMDKIAGNPQAQWFTGPGGDIKTAVSDAVGAATAAGAVPLLVAYNIPARDCGGLSAGGTTVNGYKIWISAFAAGIEGRKAIVILEPDALAQMNCLSSADQTTRVSLLQYAVSALKAQGPVAVYLDGGHSAWKSAADQAARLKRANVGAADGFALNVSNFQLTSNSVAYGKAISALIGGKHFVIDTSRNGLGPASDGQWCNPTGRGLGLTATTVTADPTVDAYLWVKLPGESDGSCSGAPAAGLWFPEYALGLAQRATF